MAVRGRGNFWHDQASELFHDEDDDHEKGLALLYSAHCRSKARDCSGAIEAYRKSLEFLGPMQKSSRAEALYHMAECIRRQNTATGDNKQRVKAHLDEAVEIFHEMIEEHIQLGDRCLDLSFDCWEYLGRFRSTVCQTAEGVGQHVTSTRSPFHKAQYHYEKAERAAKAALEIEEGRREALRALAASWRRLGHLFLFSAELETASRYYKKSFEQVLNNPSSCMSDADMLDFAEGCFCLGVLEEASRDFALATEWYRESLWSLHYTALSSPPTIHMVRTALTDCQERNRNQATSAARSRSEQRDARQMLLW